MSARSKKTSTKAKSKSKSRSRRKADEARAAALAEPTSELEIPSLLDKPWKEQRDAIEAMIEELHGHPPPQRLRTIAKHFAAAASDTKWEVRLSVARGLAFLEHPSHVKIAARLDEDDNSFVAKAARASAAKRRELDLAYQAKTDEIDEVAAELAKLREAHGERAAAAAERIAEHKFRLLTNETTHEMRTVVASLLDVLGKLDSKLAQAKISKHNYGRELRIARERTRFLKLMLDDTKKLVDEPKLEREDVVVVELLEKVAEIVRGALDIPANVTFDIDANVAVGTSVHVPRVRLLQALSSLAKNAIEAVEGEGKVILVANSPKRGWVSIAVADTGYGMDDEEIRQALLPMVSSKKDDKHTGVGLPLAKKIIERECRGSFDISSKPDVGTTVSCLLAIEN